MKSLGIAFALVLSLAAAAPVAASGPGPGQGPSPLERIEALKGSVQLAQTCCRTCSRGKACGDSCISRSYTCRKPPGCACDG